MARYLEIALYAEGPTDERFFGSLLPRICDDIHEKRSNGGELIISDAQIMRPPAAGLSRAEAVLQAAQNAERDFDVLFIHSDGGGKWNQALETNIKAPEQRLRSYLEGKYQVVGIVPVREMETWTIADGNAIRRVFGSELNNKALGIPTKAHEIEKILDPKKTLRQAYEKVAGDRCSDQAIGAFYNPIGGFVSLERLRLLSAFQRFEADLTHALADLGYFSAPK